MVSDTLVLLIYKLVNAFIKVILSGSRAVAPKGTKSCRAQGEFMYVRLYVRTSIPPPKASEAETQTSKTQTLATEVQTLASEAQTPASEAQTLASKAQTQASEAQTLASKVQTQSFEAQTQA